MVVSECTITREVLRLENGCIARVVSSAWWSVSGFYLTGAEEALIIMIPPCVYTQLVCCVQQPVLLITVTFEKGHCLHCKSQHRIIQVDHDH